jgi:DNA-binding IclR family transcriptional regulator
MVRARTHPVDREVRRILADLVAETGETAHASTLVGTNLTTSAIVETSIRGTRVYIDPAEFLPFHASGSGIACLAAMPDKDVSTLLAPGYPRFTELTPADFSDVAARIDEARQRGYVTLLGTYERDVVGIAAAVVGYDGVVGAVAVAAPVARFHPEVERLVSGAVMAAARQLSRLYGAPTGDTTS